ncbi:hypothetical protein GOBAR_AA17372 [Gossypium barbadense]|uniref:Uncharacterized protein n=1 Tax=Gossypium barbadense TaxID=3634 RepID=A0A2P5XJ05_GOSBA|nr:hypothetical protein GOBAR_AA17372 [Gossypium barbadense]
MNDLHLSFDVIPPKSSNCHRPQRSLEVGGFDSPWVLCLHISSYLNNNLIGGDINKMNDLHLSFDVIPPKSSNCHRPQRSLEVGGFDSPWVLCLHISSYLNNNLIGGMVTI